MTRASLREYAAVQRERYLRATRAEKRQLLDKVVAIAGIHRKAAIRLLRRPPPRRAPVRRPAPTLWGRRRRRGGSPVAGQWPDRRPSATLLPRRTARSPAALRGAGADRDVDKRLRLASRATLARLLAPARAQNPATITAPGGTLRQDIPIRTFTEWDDARPGFCEVDLVGHCGSSTEGFYLCTLCAVDIVTCWVELAARSASAAPSSTCTTACRSPALLRAEGLRGDRRHVNSNATLNCL